jgi:hypothetical protein
VFERDESENVRIISDKERSEEEKVTLTRAKE